jgi:NADH:ubiquinone oxidoreductase subunit 3 (subunit A)
MPSALPSSGFLTAYAAVLAFLVVAVAFLAVNLLVWKVIRPSRFSEEKLTTYECGENPVGSAWIQFNIRFYVFALIFIIFDVEAVFLLPWCSGSSACSPSSRGWCSSRSWWWRWPTCGARATWSGCAPRTGASQ